MIAGGVVQRGTQPDQRAESIEGYFGRHSLVNLRAAAFPVFKGIRLLQGEVGGDPHPPIQRADFQEFNLRPAPPG